MLGRVVRRSGFIHEINGEGDGAKDADDEERNANHFALTHRYALGKQQHCSGGKHAARRGKETNFRDADLNLIHILRDAVPISPVSLGWATWRQALFGQIFSDSSPRTSSISFVIPLRLLRIIAYDRGEKRLHGLRVRGLCYPCLRSTTTVLFRSNRST